MSGKAYFSIEILTPERLTLTISILATLKLAKTFWKTDSPCQTTKPLINYLIWALMQIKSNVKICYWKANMLLKCPLFDQSSKKIHAYINFQNNTRAAYGGCNCNPNNRLGHYWYFNHRIPSAHSWYIYFHYLNINYVKSL